MPNTEVDSKVLTRARNAAYRFLAFRPRSRAELEAKLRDYEYGDDIIQQALSELVGLGYVDDLKFASQWTESRVRLSGFGRRRIERELRAKGVDPEIIREVFAPVFGDGTELETAQRAIEKKHALMKTLPPETRRRRLAGILERRGFSFDIIRAVLSKMERSEVLKSRS